MVHDVDAARLAADGALGGQHGRRRGRLSGRRGGGQGGKRGHLRTCRLVLLRLELLSFDLKLNFRVVSQHDSHSKDSNFLANFTDSLVT